jgi:hypothetical protein
MEIKDKTNQERSEGQKATHSGWMQYLEKFSQYRDESTRLSRIINGGNFNQAAESLKAFYSSLLTFAQQVFPFYSEIIEEKLTEEWIGIGEEINNFLEIYNDPLLRNQMIWELKAEIPKELLSKLFKFFNKISRMAMESGLGVNQEDKSNKEPKKGLVGLR